MLDYRKFPRQSVYDWPENLDEEVIFAYRRNETRQEAQTRIVNAAHMKWQNRKLGWKFKTRRTDYGIGFEWKKDH